MFLNRLEFNPKRPIVYKKFYLSLLLSIILDMAYKQPPAAQLLLLLKTKTTSVFISKTSL